MCHLFGREHVAAILLAPTHTHTHRERHTHTETVDWSLEYDVIFQPELIVSRAQLSPWSQRERESNVGLCSLTQCSPGSLQGSNEELWEAASWLWRERDGERTQWEMEDRSDAWMGEERGVQIGWTMREGRRTRPRDPRSLDVPVIHCYCSKTLSLDLCLTS